MVRTKVFRDPVHTNIEFDRTSTADVLALKLLDTPPVQRLRHVRQLALASYVYHGAEHSRFSHTLGVVHLAKRLYAAVCANSERQIDERKMALVLGSAVLHDCGHAPFSHAIEKVLGVSHEDISSAILQNDPDVSAVFQEFGDSTLPDEIAAHITGESDTETASIISSQLDADRLDYVLRDGFHAGVPSSRFDLERILQLARVDDEGLFFDDRAQIAIESYLIARYHLYLQLYFHKTNRSAEVVLRGILERARVDLTRFRGHRVNTADAVGA